MIQSVRLLAAGLLIATTAQIDPMPVDPPRAEMYFREAKELCDRDNGRNEIKMGMNVPGNDNRQFLLNIMHWLTRLGE